MSQVVIETLVHKSNPPVANFIDTNSKLYPEKDGDFLQRSITNTLYGPVTYLWHFGDPANTTSTAFDTVFTYPALGSYTVSLTVYEWKLFPDFTKALKLVSESADFCSKQNSCLKMN
jgi:PKD repeat protein